MADYRAEVTEERSETWRECDHDDLVMTLALALFVGGLPSSPSDRTGDLLPDRWAKDPARAGP